MSAILQSLQVRSDTKKDGSLCGSYKTTNTVHWFLNNAFSSISKAQVHYFPNSRPSYQIKTFQFTHDNSHHKYDLWQKGKSTLNNMTRQSLLSVFLHQHLGKSRDWILEVLDIKGAGYDKFYCICKYSFTINLNKQPVVMRV